MERVRLDIGTVVQEKGDGNKFVFSLSRGGSNQSIRVELTPAQMHILLSNLNHISEDGITTQELYYKTLTSFLIEVLEVIIIRNLDNSGFDAKLVLFDGDKEMDIICSVVDGAVIAKKFACAIYIDLELLDKYGVEGTVMTQSDKELNYLGELKIQLKLAIDSEDYEKAAIISKEIFKQEQDNKLTN